MNSLNSCQLQDALKTFLISCCWTDTSLRYRHWRMCFERLLQAFARWQPGNLFDIAAQPILEYRELIVIHNCPCEHSFKVATVYSIHTQSLSWCSTGLVPNVLPRRDEGSGKPSILHLNHHIFHFTFSHFFSSIVCHMHVVVWMRKK